MSAHRSFIGCLGFSAALGGLLGLGLGGFFSRLGLGLGFGDRLLVLAAVCQVLLLAGFEVRLVPAAAFQTEGWRRHEFLQPGFAAFRTLLQWCVADFLQDFQLVAAGLALILIYRHGLVSRKWAGAPYVRTCRACFKSRRRRGVPL